MKIWKIIILLSFIPGLIFFPEPGRISLNQSDCNVSFSHFFGCDSLGRDVYSMYSYGILLNFFIAIPARILSLALSLAVLSFRFSGIRTVKMLTDSFASVFLSVPSILVGLLIAVSFGKSLPVFLFALAASDWALSYETLSGKLRETENGGFITVSFLFGADRFYVFRKHLLPVLMEYSKTLFVIGLPGVIMTASLFSYLGLDFGVSFFGPGLGEQISFSKDYFFRNPFSTAVPVFGILFSILLFRENHK